MNFASIFPISLPFKKNLLSTFQWCFLGQPYNDPTKKENFLQMREQKQKAGLYDC